MKTDYIRLAEFIKSLKSFSQANENEAYDHTNS